MNNRQIIASAIGAGAAIVLTAGIATAAEYKTVTISVDGATRSVSTFDRDVAKVLEHNDIKIGPHDKVTPAINETPQRNGTIEIRKARSVGVMDDGVPKQEWVTEKDAVGLVESVSGKEVPLARSQYETPVSSSVSQVNVVVDGKTNTVEVEENQSVKSALESAGVTLGPLDQVNVAADNQKVSVVVKRVERKAIIKKEKTTHPVKEVKDDSIAKGEKKVVTKGQDGVVEKTKFVETVDGAVSHTSESAVVEIKKPVTEVVHIGTNEELAKTKAAEGAPGSGSYTPGDDVWAKLAQCESGGNPAAISANGLYHGLYQFSVGTWRAVGGSGLPSSASPAEQTKRAKILQKRSGWGQWPACSARLGLR